MRQTRHGIAVLNGILSAELFLYDNGKNNVAECLRNNKDNIIVSWEYRVRESLAAAKITSHPALLDSIPVFIEMVIKSFENDNREVAEAARIGVEHALQRSAYTTFSLDEILSEYKILLQVILEIVSNNNINLNNGNRNLIIDIIHSGKAAAAKTYAELSLEKQRDISHALQEAEEFRRRMLESSEDCFKVLDLNGILTDITERSLTHLELLNAEAVMGKSWSEDIWVRPEDRIKAREAIAAARKGHVGNFIGYYRTRSGKREWWEVTISPMNDESGKPEKLLAVSRDVTKQKKAIEQLEMSEVRFRQIFELSGVGKVLSDPETKKILKANKSFCELVGYNQEELQKMRLQDLSYPEDRLIVIDDYNKFSKDIESHWHAEKRYVCKNAKVIWVSLYATSLLDPAGKSIVLFTVIDISDRKKIEAEREILLEKERNTRLARDKLLHHLETLQKITEAALLETTTLQSLLNKSLETLKSRIPCDTMVILLLREDQKTLEVRSAIGLNGEMEQKIHIPIGEGIAGKILATGKRVRIDHLNKGEVLSPVLREKEIDCLIGVPLKVKGRNLGVLHVGRMTECPFTEEDLDLLELIADRLSTAIDNAQLYDKLLKNIDTLEFERAMREQFVNTLTHDLRNPLTAARMSAQVMARTLDQERVADLASKVITAIERADRMIQDLLDANRIRAGHPLPIELADCDLVALTSDVVEEFKRIHGPRFYLKMPSELKAHISCKDYVRVLENLIGNAIKYGCDKEVAVVLEKMGDDQFQLSVHNWGNPIPEEKLHQLFNPFTRASEVETSGKKGWGLGLTLVLGVAEAHGGKINIVSNEKEGTTFSVVMPLKKM